MKMNACVLHDINDLRYEQVSIPEPQKDEVLMKIRASGICGSDMGRVFEKGTYHFPTIPGHEFAGEIIDAGNAELAHLVGTKAAVFPLLPCFTCSSCEIGEYAQCKQYDYYGSRRDGGFAEYLAVKAFNLVPIPDAVSFEEAAMCEPTAVAIHALSQAGIQYGDTVAIFGAGTIGIMLAKIARSWGAEKIILADIDDRKLAFAKKLGFEHAINNRDVDICEAIQEITENRGADVVVEGTGVSPALESCMKVAGTFGRVVLMGNPAKDMSLSQKAYWEILRKQLSLKGTWNSSYNGNQNDWRTAIAAMPKLNLCEFITHRFTFDQCNEAFSLMKSQTDFIVKIMFVNK